MKVWKDERDGTEYTHIRVPVSSTSEDRDGDHFDDDGLDDLKAGFDRADTPVYLDHGLDESGFPAYRTEDMIGRWVKGEREGDELFATAFLEPDNPKAEMLEQKLRNKMPVGFSVGFRAEDTTEKDSEGVVFHGTDLLECSAVGIPSNPDAVVASAIKSAANAEGVELTRADAAMVAERIIDSFSAAESGDQGKDTMSDTDGTSESGSEETETREVRLDEDSVERVASAIMNDTFKEFIRGAVEDAVTEALEDTTSEPDETGTEGEESEEESAEPDETASNEDEEATPRGVQTGVNTDTGDGEGEEKRTSPAERPSIGPAMGGN